MKIETQLAWLLRKGGGLFVGVRFTFDNRVEMEDGEVMLWNSLTLAFLVFALNINFYRPA